MAGKAGHRQYGNVRKLPSGRFQARYRGPDGRVHSEMFATRAEASRFLARAQSDVDRGAWLNPALGRITFADWTEHFMAGSHRRATTEARYSHVIRAHLLPEFGSAGLGAITPLHVRRAVEEWANHLAPATVRTNYAVLRAILNGAVEADVLGRSPCRGVKLPPEKRRERCALSPGDLARLGAAMPERYAAMVYVGGVLGLRWSEVAGLRVGRLNFLARTITVAETVSEVDGIVTMVEDTKTRASSRTLTVPAFLMDMLAAHLARAGLTAEHADALVFTAPGGGPLRATNFRNRVWAGAVKAVGLDDLTFHGLRHAAASLMVDLGEHPRVIQHRLGHATARLSMELYAHVSDTADKAVAGRLDDLFGSANGTGMARGPASETGTGL